MKLEDLTGQRFGRLLVVERALNRIQPSGKTIVFWKCKCRGKDCNKTIEVAATSLQSGNTRSCGCLQKDELAAMKNKKRDGTEPFRLILNGIINCTKLRNANIKTRQPREVCITPNDLKILYEKQKGICPYTGWKMEIRKRPSRICLADRGRKIPHQASVDRIDSTLGYVKGNIQFVSLMANYAKNQFTNQELFYFCKAVAKRFENHCHPSEISPKTYVVQGSQTDRIIDGTPFLAVPIAGSKRCKTCNKEIASNRKAYCSVACFRKDRYEPLAPTYRNLLRRKDGTINVNGTKLPPKVVNITLEDLKDIWNRQEGICPFTGWNLIPRRRRDVGRGKINQASIDRIDNSHGYEKDNIQFVCLIANFAKNKFTDDDLIGFCKAVAAKYP